MEISLKINELFVTEVTLCSVDSYGGQIFCVGGCIFFSSELLFLTDFSPPERLPVITTSALIRL